MKSLSGAVQGLIAAAFIGFGVLCGLAVGVLIHGFDIGGVAPLFTNALGAAIGASITLWFSEHRAERAEQRQRRADLRKVVTDLATIITNLETVSEEIQFRDITGRSVTALHLLRQTLARQSSMFAILATADLLDHMSQLIFDLGHAERVVNLLQPMSYAELKENTFAAGDALAEELARIARDTKATLMKLR